MQFFLQFTLIGILCVCGDAFWWSEQTTTESPQLLKQVPVGYFRTYTYQPLSYSQRFPAYSRLASPYSYDNANIGWPQYNAPLPQPPPAKPHYSPSSTTQTSTTTTPTPPKSTSTEWYQSPQTPPTASDSPNFQSSPQFNGLPGFGSYSSLPIIGSQSSIQANAQSSMPTYSQIYPNPDLAGYQYLPGSMAQTMPQVQFVPCMCPVTISVGAREMLENRAIPEDEDLLQSNNEGEDSTASLKD